MVARRTALWRHLGQYQGKGRAGVCAGSGEVNGSAIMDTHYMYRRIARVIVLKDGFDVNLPPGELQAKVVVERPRRPLRPSLGLLVDDIATLKMIVHGL